MKHRTPAYWPTRILLAVGIVVTAVVALVLGDRALMTGLESCISCRYSDVLGLPSNVLATVVGLALAVFGLVWMLRIFRGPRDKPPVWRYRDR